MQFYRENWEVIFFHLHRWLGSDQAVADELAKLLPDNPKVRSYRNQIRKFRSGQPPNSDMSHTMGKAALYLHERERERPHLDSSRKQCIRCKQIKNVKEFPKRSGGVKGHNTVCKNCCSQFASGWGHNKQNENTIDTRRDATGRGAFTTEAANKFRT